MVYECIAIALHFYILCEIHSRKSIHGDASVQTCKECFKKLEYEVLMVNLLSGGDFLKLFHLKKYKDMPQNLYKQRLISAELRL